MAATFYSIQLSISGAGGPYTWEQITLYIHIQYIFYDILGPVNSQILGILFRTNIYASELLFNYMNTDSRMLALFHINITKAYVVVIQAWAGHDRAQPLHASAE